MSVTKTNDIKDVENIIASMGKTNDAIILTAIKNTQYGVTLTYVKGKLVSIALKDNITKETKLVTVENLRWSIPSTIDYDQCDITIFGGASFNNKKYELELTDFSTSDYHVQHYSDRLLVLKNWGFTVSFNVSLHISDVLRSIKSLVSSNLAYRGIFISKDSQLFGINNIPTYYQW